jgi:hypothetical protein
MKNYLINYADKGFKQAQQINSYTGLLNGIDKVINYNLSDLDSKFVNENIDILSQSRGAGYWLWKPYVILKTLERVNDNDIVFYSDSGVEFIDSVTPLIDLCKKETKGVLTFHMEPTLENKEVLQTKKDAFVLMGCDTSEYQNSWPRLASYSIWQKNPFSLQIINEWLEYAKNPHILTDIPNQCGIDEDDRHNTHRHDQSIFSLLTKKHNISAYPDPSQWGNNYRKTVSYNQIINHTRYRS